MRNTLHVISTGRQNKEELIEKIVSIHPYIDYVHLREKNWRAIDYIEVIRTLEKYRVSKEKIIVNDRVDVAYVMDVYGVQLAYHSIEPAEVCGNFPELYIGCSVHSPQEAKEKEKQGANYVIFGHVFQTASKQGLPPKGLDELKQVVEQVNIPVIAIGGITPENVESVLKTGAQGVAVLSGILLAKDVVEAAKRYRHKLTIGKGERNGIND